MTDVERQSLQNQTAIMCALALLMRTGSGTFTMTAGQLAESRLGEAIARTRTLTEAPEGKPVKHVPFVASSMDVFATCPGCGGPDHCARRGACASPSGALAEANANREHLRQATAEADRRQRVTECPHGPECARGARECVCAAMGQ